MKILFDDDYFMGQAIAEAKKAYLEGEIPVGSIITIDQRIIARAHNLSEKLNDVTAHAEMQAFTSAFDYLGGRYLNECTLYVTLEPCIMCAGASFWSQLNKIIYGASDKKRGFSTISKSILHPKTEVKKGVLEKECSKILTDFFQKKR